MSDRDPSERTPKDITSGEVRAEDIAPEATAAGADMGEARLAGVDGLGTLQVVRDRNDTIVHVEGTWRPHDEGVDVSGLDAEVQADRPVRYQGKLQDPANPGNDRCDVEVKITSRSDYTYDARKEDDGRTLPVYNFSPVSREDIVSH